MPYAARTGSAGEVLTIRRMVEAKVFHEILQSGVGEIAAAANSSSCSSH
jgi:hypothetical protein